MHNSYRDTVQLTCIHILYYIHYNIYILYCIHIDKLWLIDVHLPNPVNMHEFVSTDFVVSATAVLTWYPKWWLCKSSRGLWLWLDSSGLPNTKCSASWQPLRVWPHAQKRVTSKRWKSVASLVWPKRCVCIVFSCFYHRHEGLLFSWVPLDDLCFACCVLVSRQKVWVMPATVHFLCSLFSSFLILDAWLSWVYLVVPWYLVRVLSHRDSEQFPGPLDLCSASRVRGQLQTQILEGCSQLL